MTYVEPTDVLQGERVKASRWNVIVNDIININARIAVLEAAAGEEPPASDFPIGGIILWSGNAATIPSGWHICDGTSGTVDLRSKFVYGASADGDVGDEGGATTHTHTNSGTGSDGGHSHNVSGTTGTPSSSNTAATGLNTAASSTHTHSFTTSTTSGGAHSHTVPDTTAASNLPPYIMYYFIQKIS